MHQQQSRQDHKHANGETQARLADEPDSWPAPALYVRSLVRRVEREVRLHPIRTLGLAVGVGVGAGTLLASRIARMLLVSAGSYAAKEFVQGRVKAFFADA